MIAISSGWCYDVSAKRLQCEKCGQMDVSRIGRKSDSPIRFMFQRNFVGLKCCNSADLQLESFGCKLCALQAQNEKCTKFANDLEVWLN